MRFTSTEVFKGKESETSVEKKNEHSISIQPQCGIVLNVNVDYILMYILDLLMNFNIH